MTTILKSTTKGQITIPAAWRKKFPTDRFIAKMTETSLIIQPLELPTVATTDEYTVFDAIRDNKGKGIKAADLIALLDE